MIKELITEAYPVWYFTCPNCEEDSIECLSDDDFKRENHPEEHIARRTCEHCEVEVIVTRSH